jgi:hypothetical protein
MSRAEGYARRGALGRAVAPARYTTAALSIPFPSLGRVVHGPESIGTSQTVPTIATTAATVKDKGDAGCVFGASLQRFCLSQFRIPEDTSKTGIGFRDSPNGTRETACLHDPDNQEGEGS